jgi:hypothetical protein
MPKQNSSPTKRAPKPVKQVARSGADTVTTINVSAKGKLARYHTIYTEPAGDRHIAYFTTQSAMREFVRGR